MTAQTDIAPLCDSAAVSGSDHRFVVHDWQTCEDDGCDECQRLIEDGIVMGCDGHYCPARGYVEIGAPEGNVRTDWHLCEDGAVLCGRCFEHLHNTDSATTSQHITQNLTSESK